MTALSRQLLFYDYLEKYLETSSLALFRRILHDFYAHHEHTLQDFIRLGATVISVLPFERKDHIKEAARLLADHKASNTTNELVESTCVYAYLTARVATRNILWLRDMYREFWKGENTLLREFVRRGSEAISVIPVDIQALNDSIQPVLIASEGEVTATDAMKTFSVSSLNRSKAPLFHEFEAIQAIGSMPACTRRRIWNTFKRLEVKEPWKLVFQFEKLTMPFSMEQYPQVLANLEVFWNEHARAVWERNFWLPRSDFDTLELHNQRRLRQCKALLFFEQHVLTPLLHRDHGAAFIDAINERAEELSGWFYCHPAVNLMSLAQRYGVSRCLQYIESEAFERFPDFIDPTGLTLTTQIKGKRLNLKSSGNVKLLMHEIANATNIL
ncbi:hypothetical protein CCR75_009060 [Bremia lactucae]|uniref:Uncharacterized protein n=1 Tax=Bremia lactucae TaxID=4779 RepID=A0A976IHE8_BRELC|nr:hypothetical protein CCR75_009060 [Bremia lactucae]